MTGASRARPSDRPCVPYEGRTNPRVAKFKPVYLSYYITL